MLRFQKYALVLVLNLVFSLLAQGADFGPDFEDYIRNVMDKYKTPGVAVAVIGKDGVLYKQGFGYRDIEKKLPVTPRTLFAIGSTTKAFTAAATGILVDEGKVSFNRPVKQYMPTFALHDPVATERATLRDLLGHTTGLPRHDLMWYGSNWTRQELFDRLRFLQPSAAFGEKFQYNNLMFMTAGMLIQTLSGSTWEEFIKSRIFGPLGMSSSTLSTEESQKSDDFSLPYADAGPAGIVAMPFRDLTAIAPAGSINSNLEDMSRWVRLHLNQGRWNGKTLISETSITEAYKPHILTRKAGAPFPEFSDSYYGMAWGILDFRGHRMLSHDGGIDGFVANVSFMPDEGYGVVVLLNNTSISAQALAFHIWDRILNVAPSDWIERFKDTPSQPNPDPVFTPSDRPLDDFVGVYENPAYGKVTITAGHDQAPGADLIVVFNVITAPLRHTQNLEFSIPGVPQEAIRKISFGQNDNGKIVKLRWKLEASADPIEFTR
ncbi:MAG: hypothetical protein A2428_08660 [Bdellovibrionales bacterium RIFOXYC1_FULL_54_43]|nr:MAG: hypothetical protein A2428_08660 [Bdellovibrionales bacterium RIFOXYC1_FULL_54_43]OFZ84287.1 MAG: hypothetical protein A2603_15240 [Bdellovibrionales bacterium RIFOXYD1_FULL_55_31]